MSSEHDEGKDRPDAGAGGEAAEDERPSGDPEQRDRRASDDLAEGLELMLRAARKAVRDIDTKRLEQLGKRARSSLENINPKKVEEFGRKAAERLDPRRIEEIANDAGRELISVVERLADRVDRAVAGAAGRRPRKPDAPEGDSEPSDDAGETPDASPDSEDRPARVRVED